MANADCIVIQGSNMAECHPVGYQWVAEAKARGAKVIHVDPRFTRTSAVSDKHIPIRAGSDVVLLGALGIAVGIGGAVLGLLFTIIKLALMIVLPILLLWWIATRMFSRQRTY